MFCSAFRNCKLLAILFLIACACAPIASAQGTEFTYQGKLMDGTMPANASYDFEFRLFALANGGTELGMQARSGVLVTNGVFTVRLDFGANFDGSPRWVAIAVRSAGAGAFTPLDPRQPISSAPYSIKSLNAATADVAINATQLGGEEPNYYVASIDPRLSDARNPLPFSANYIQNRTSQQPGTSNFNISGTGAANILNAVTQYNLDGDRLLSTPGNNNFFAGVGSGIANSSGSFNAFFGSFAGTANNTGSSNTFFGSNAGVSNATGSGNSFFGSFAGNLNTGGDNSFFGRNSGAANLSGNENSFFGNGSGSGNTSGDDNTFIGTFAGGANTTGFRNTLIGHSANVGSNNLTNATAIGYNAIVNASNTMVLGTNAITVSIPGQLSVTGQFNAPGAVFTNLSTTITNLNVTGLLNGSGSGLTAINASNITSGTLSNARLGVVPIANGGTGSATRNYVDLTSNEFIGGNKSFTNTVNTSAQYNILGQRVLGAAADQNNVFVGIDAGAANASTGSTFVGDSAGLVNSSGQDNSFFGRDAGNANTTGHRNSFFGVNAGGSNIDGLNNAFFGNNAGNSNTTGSSNTVIGYNADVGAGDLTNATAIGSGAVVNNSNTMVLGTGTDTVNIPGTLNVGGGGQIARLRMTTVVHDFPPVFYNQDRVVQLPGAQLGDVVVLGLPNGFSGCCLVFTAWVSSPGFVTIRVDNTDNQGQGTIDPPSGTYRILLFGF